MVWGRFGLVTRLLFGLVLERQQVGLLLLQALMESLGLALLLELPPLELLLQSVGSFQGGEKRRESLQQVLAWQTKADWKSVSGPVSVLNHSILYSGLYTDSSIHHHICPFHPSVTPLLLYFLHLLCRLWMLYYDVMKIDLVWFYIEYKHRESKKYNIWKSGLTITRHITDSVHLKEDALTKRYTMKEHNISSHVLVV